MVDEGGGSEFQLEKGERGVVSEGKSEKRGPPMVCGTKWLQLFETRGGVAYYQ